MVRRRRDRGSYPAGAVFNRARKQFQILYEREGTFTRACAAQELILWPDLFDKDGAPIRPPLHVLQAWAREVDDGDVVIPPKLKEAFLRRYDAYMESSVREAVIENAKTAKDLAIQAREGRLSAEKASQYMHANNGAGFLLRNLREGRPQELQKRQLRNIKLLSPKKRQKALPEGVIDGEFTVKDAV